MNSPPDANVAANGEGRPYRYTAFISYRHVEPDRKWAKWLHQALETYRVPPRLARARRLPLRVGRCFRDEEELPASDNLAREIDQALKESRFLIVVCSPRIVSSRWCNKEVERFRELGRHDRILALLVEGEPSESFLPSLREIRTTLTDATGLTREQLQEVEPLAADVRPLSGERPRHLRHLARLRLLAQILGVRFDDLRQREHERSTRRLGALAGGAACLVLILTVLTVFALVQRRTAKTNEALANANAQTAKTNATRANRNAQLASENAEHERIQRVRADANAVEARRQLAGFLEERGRQYLTEGQTGQAGALLVEALRNDPERPRLGFLLGLAARPLQAQTATLEGHADAIQELAVSPDGRRVATAGDDGVIAVWDTASGVPLQAFRDKDPNFSPRHLIFAPTGDLLLSTDQGVVRVWEASTGRMRAAMRHGYGTVNDMELSPDGRWLVTTATMTVMAEDATIKVWDWAVGRVVWGAVHGTETKTARWSPDGTLLVSGGNDGTARIWDAVTGTLRCSWQLGGPGGNGSSDAGEVTATCFAPGGDVVATASGEQVKLWRLRSSQAGEGPSTIPAPGKPERTLDTGETRDLMFSRAGDRLLVRGVTGIKLFNLSPSAAAGGQLKLEGTSSRWPIVRSATFSADGSLLAAAEDAVVRVWDARTGVLLAELAGHARPVTALRFTPDANRIVTVSLDGRGIVWDWRSVRAVPPMVGSGYAIASARYAMGGDVVVTRALDNSVRVFDARTGTQRCVILHPRPEGTSAWNGVRLDLALSPDGRYAATAGPDDSARIWDLASGKPIQVLRHILPATDGTTGGRATTVAFAPDGRRAAVGGTDRTVSVWDLASGREIGRTSRVFANAVDKVEFAPRQDTLLASDRLTVRTWALGGAATPLRDLFTRAAVGRCDVARFTPDGLRLVMTNLDKSVRVCDTHTGRVESTLGPLSVNATLVEVSPDGKVAATAGRNTVVDFWDVATGRALSQWRTPDQGSGVKALAFHPAAEVAAIAVASDVFLIDWRNGQTVAVARPQAGDVLSVAFDATGRSLLTGNADKTARVWPLLADPNLVKSRTVARIAATGPATSETVAAASTTSPNGSTPALAWEAKLVENVGGWRVREGQLVPAVLAGKALDVIVSDAPTPNEPQVAAKPAGSQAGAATTQPNVESLVKQGQDLVQAGAGERAIAVLTEALARQSNHPKALLFRAIAYQEVGRSADAITDADHVLGLAIDPRTAAVAHQVRAQLHMAAGHVDQALADTKAIVDANPPKGSPRTSGETALAKRSWLTAVVCFDRAIAAGDDGVPVHLGRAKGYLGVGQPARALPDLNAAIGKVEASSDPGTAAELYYLRGSAKGASGDQRAAISDYTAALKLDPHHARAMNDRGLARRTLDPADLALDDFSAAITADPNLPQPRLNRATSLIKRLQSRSDTRPDDAEPAEEAKRASDIDTAVSDLETYLRLWPDAPNRETVEDTLNKCAQLKQLLSAKRQAAPATEPTNGPSGEKENP